MKVNENPLKARLFGIIITYRSIRSRLCSSPPDYVFKNSVLISGTINMAGSSYRFPAVKPGVDAIVLINSISTDVKIVDFDDNANGGFNDAFQPRIQAKGKTSGYAEF